VGNWLQRLITVVNHYDDGKWSSSSNFGMVVNGVNVKVWIKLRLITRGRGDVGRVLVVYAGIND
jgi:hypothetical protein